MGRNSLAARVPIRPALDHGLDYERRVLEAIHANPCIRSLLDFIEEPHTLILRHLDDNLLDVSSSKRLDKTDIKYVA